MTDFSDTTAPTDTILNAATQDVAIPPGTVLLGTVTAQNVAYALVKSQGGEVAKVKPGDRIGRQTVAAIEQGQLILMLNGQTSRMVIPGS